MVYHNLARCLPWSSRHNCPWRKNFSRRSAILWSCDPRTGKVEETTWEWDWIDYEYVFFQNDIFANCKFARSRRTFFWIMTLRSPRFLIQLSWHISRDFVLGRMKWFWWCWALNRQPVPSKVMPRRVWNCLRSLERGLKMLECFAVSLFLM